ncbi:glycosyltransferase family 2 protein [Maricaulis sp.]|uniref:glycosyltransferase family 2 protein n=1 Tax=Maricaulis sp. TaxID=1486257 RepID=UPI003A902867
MARPLISIVVIAYQMRRELPRTVQSLCPPFQRGIDQSDVELIIVDNGSTEPVTLEQLSSTIERTVIINVSDADQSPAAAANQGLRQASADLVGLWIDGARLASPGVLAGALAASRMDPLAPVVTLGFHLGDKPQGVAIREGYNQRVEDELLAGIDWTKDGYRLFEICALGGSSRLGWFANIVESNALFLPARLWQQLGGLDEAFRSRGGGLVNLDLFTRALDAAGTPPITLLGEGTFHQVHGGVATNAPESPWKEFAEEYQQIKGKAYERPPYKSRYLSVLDGERLDPLLQKFR